MDDSTAVPWRDFQASSRDLFGEMGLKAENDVRIAGARTTHDIDVLVEFDHAGLHLRWIVECKLWRVRVSKLHVLALRTIVEDVGADRGILLAESGFQSGAGEAALHSNVSLTTLSDLRADASAHLTRARLDSFPRRIAEARRRYWDIPKSERERRGLRPDGPASGWSGTVVLSVLTDVLLSALAGVFPPDGTSGQIYLTVFDHEIADASDSVLWIDTVLGDMENRLDDISGLIAPHLPTIFDRNFGV